MNGKITSSIRSLKNWSEKIINDAAKDQRRLQFFKQDFNMSDYHRFYFELMPYLEKLAANDSELFQPLIDKYRENGDKLNEAMKENFLSRLLGSILLDIPLITRSADDLVYAIKEIKANSENIENSLSING